MVDKKETTSQFLQNRIKKILTCGEGFLSFHRIYSSRFSSEYHLYADTTLASAK